MNIRKRRNVNGKIYINVGAREIKRDFLFMRAAGGEGATQSPNIYNI